MVVHGYFFFFFFFKQKTAYEIYQCDWSSDVCSSDLVSRITSAVEEERLELFYQPIVGIGKRNANSRGHYELLLRMRDENGELVQPNSFIPAAERYNLMSTLDRWVIHEALSQLADRNPEADTARFTLAINLSGSSLSEDRFLEFVIEELSRQKLPAGAICFEITETAAISNLSRVIHFMQTLKKLGCMFSLDDFKIDEQSGKARCPAGKTSHKRRRVGGEDPGWRYQFSRKDCTGCELRAPCTRAESNAKVVQITAKTEALQPHGLRDQGGSHSLPAGSFGEGRSLRSSQRSGKPVTGRREAASSQDWDWKVRRSLVNTGASMAALSEARARVLKIQTKLHQWAGDDDDRRFDDLFNLVAGFLTVFVVAQFQDTLARYALLAAFMPLVAGLSGNSGAQDRKSVV